MAPASRTDIASRVIRVALVTNIPAPYRLPMYELLAQAPGLELKLFFCSGREPDRLWDLQRLRVGHVFLRERVLTWSRRYIHTNPDVWSRLDEFSPDVVVTTGFNPTHLIAFAYARARRAHHVAMTDGTLDSETRLSAVHRWLRRRVYRRSAAFVGASEGSFALYRQYGLPEAALFKSHLCANNPAFMAARRPGRDVDLIFCGRFAPGKLPLFAIDVATAAARLLDRQVSLLLVGAGELEQEMRQAVARAGDCIDAEFAGFARQAELPTHYSRAKVLLFPTSGDTWGVVANEACAAGVPVIVSPQAGVAGDLVCEGENGHVLPLDVEKWARAAARLIGDESAWQRMSARALELVSDYTYSNAAKGLADAVAHAVASPQGASGSSSAAPTVQS
jgi:glycosyltransferase involved in cell wall biosynthesis